MYNLEYIYLILILFFLFCREKGKSGQYSFSYPKLICILLYISFWGLRGFIGTDFSWYYPYYTDLPTDSLSSALNYYSIDIEPGYVIYMLVCKFAGLDYHGFVFLSTCLNVLFMHFIFKKYLRNYYILGYILFIAFSANAEFNNLRNIRSILLFFISIDCIVQKRFWLFCVLNLIGLSFHNTALFYFPFYFILNRNWKKLILPISLIGFLLILLKMTILTDGILYLGSLLGGKYESAASVFLLETEDKGFTLGALVRLVMGIGLFFIYDKIKEPVYRIYANLFVCYLFCFSFFNEIPVFRLRFSLMFAMSLCIIIPYIYRLLSFKQKPIYIVFMSVVILSQALLNFQGPLFKYDNLLWGVESYMSRMNTFSLHVI